jgi:dihydrofolate synthase/folylpolyglutamate synthase
MGRWEGRVYNFGHMLAYLQSMPDLGARPQGVMSAADFTLARMQWLLDALGNPQQAYPSLHVAGTNGKGSVCTLAAAALLASGLRVGCFTSPHWRGAWQGIAVDGEPAQLGELEASFALLRPHLEQREGWTQFEVVTALAFQHFARVGAQVAVVEVGLGGSLDATNVITPSVAVITPVDYDHTSILGNSLAQIAAHKSGIIKPGVPLVLAPQVEEAGAVIRGVAREKKAPVTEVGVDVLFAECGHTLAGQDLAVWSAAAPQERTELHILLLGQHQVVNASTAYAA